MYTKFWTDKREMRLVDHYKKHKRNPRVYVRIANIMKASSPNSIYKKLGRLGMISAPWAKRESKKSRRR